MSIAPVTGIKVPVSFMGKAEGIENKKPKVDPSKVVDEFNKEANETADALKDTGAAVTNVTGAAAGVAAPIVAIKATIGNKLQNILKSPVVENGYKVFDPATPKEFLEDVADDAGNVIGKKLKTGLSDEQLKQVVYKMKTSKVKVGVAIAAAVAVVGAVIKSLSDKKKAEAPEAPAETPEAAPEVDTSAEAVEETEETPEEE
ncbi:hypothetical protein IJC60_04910 [bacterium]|nr:hypothetical protein [bacterium]